MKATLIDSMGSDLTVVNAARVSFNKESDWDSKCTQGHDLCSTSYGFLSCPLCETSLSEQDTKLIHYLARNGHWTPFGHPQVTIHEKVPIFVARQRFKHMVGFVYNEVSRRYVDEEPEFFYPEEWRGRPKNAKQGSEGVVEGPFHGLYTESVYDHFEDSQVLYENMINAGVAPEMARMVLPQAMYTEYYVTGSLAAWSRAYKQRIDPHAQKEIQGLAEQWGQLIEPLFPVSWKALTE